MLSAFIAASTIDAGDISPPRVGSVIELILDFIETPDSAADAVTLDAVLELQPTPRLDGHRDHPDGRYWCWIGDLYGDGWRATWFGRRPRMGPVSVTGRFQYSRGLAYRRGSHGEVRGRVTRVQVKAIAHHCPDGSRWQPLRAAPPRYRDVALAPRWFDRGGRRDEESDPKSLVWRDSGVLIDIDLDNVPRRTPRPKMVPGDVSIGDHGIWVVDNQLPLAALLVGDVATEYVFPGTVTSGRYIRATADGCTITEGLDTYRCVIDKPFVRTPAAQGIAIDGVIQTFERVDKDSYQVVLTSHNGERTVVDAVPPGWIVAATTVDSGHFIIAVRDSGAPDKPTYLARISTAGDVRSGPMLPNDERDWDKRITLVNKPLRVLQDRWLTLVGDDLGLAEQIPFHESLLWAGQAGDTAWIVTHPPSGQRCDPTASWPLPGPVDYDRSRGQFWLLTFLDSHSQPLFSYPTSSPRPSVAVDRDGHFWITDHGLRRLPDEPMAWSDPVDFDAAITSTITPDPESNEDMT